MPLPHLASRLYGTPLLVARSKLDIILSVLGERIHWPEPQSAIPLPPSRVQTDAPFGIAVVSIHGTLVRRGLGLDAASGLTSYGEIGAMLDTALPPSFRDSRWVSSCAAQSALDARSFRERTRGTLTGEDDVAAHVLICNHTSSPSICTLSGVISTIHVWLPIVPSARIRAIRYRPDGN